MLNKPLHRQFQEEGYIILPEVLVGEELTRLRKACDSVLEQYTVEHDKENPGQDFVNIINLNESKWHLGSREHLITLLETIASPRLLGPVEQIFMEPSIFYTTQYWVNPRFNSKDGSWHRDCQFMTVNEEEEKEYLRAAWASSPTGVQFQIALADNDDVEFVPYSGNRYDSPEEYHIRLADNKIHSGNNEMPNALRVALKAGDAILFNANGLHRGRYYTDIFRRTLMVTYTTVPHFTYFSQQPCFLERGYMDGLSSRAAAYLGDFVKTYRHFWEEQDTTG